MGFFYFSGFFRIVLSSVYQDYQLNCPSFSQWKIRGNELCNSSLIYTCLLNTNEDQYNEHCGFGLNLLEPGYKSVISGMLDRRPCGPERFQPFSMFSNVSTRCVTRKSQCNGEGQVVYNNGTTTHDRSCGCNYIDNFVFVNKPKARCFCFPSEEDCSCYNKACPVDYYLTPDYDCIHISNWTGIFNCSEIQQEKKPTGIAPTQVTPITDSRPDSTYFAHKKLASVIVLVIASLILVYYLCAGLYTFCMKYKNLKEFVRLQQYSKQQYSRYSELSADVTKLSNDLVELATRNMHFVKMKLPDECFDEAISNLETAIGVMCMVNNEIQTQTDFDKATHGGLKILEASFKLQMLFLNNMLSSLQKKIESGIQ
ncbi:unnamed protein product [Mytilus coruscus]|uniref:Uncharacterized protein n=1 Tax=Mytilus coruscus TaxID=42192 RepID=A0A6J8DN31_MYTCO|nr:unnamed protein product [Mytilus coruscus]